MKKGIVVLICLVIVLLCTKCYKEPTYEVLIKCYYSTNEFEKGDPVPECTINIGKEGFADWAIKEGKTDATGQYKATFRYEALLEVRGKLEDIELRYVINPATGDTLDVSEYHIMYFGKGNVKLIPNEVATLELLLVKEDLGF